MIGITGQIGAGKSYVGHLLRKRKIRVIDADLAVHQLYRDHQELRKSIEDFFGSEALSPSGVNRNFFSDLIFRNENARIQLEQLVYPVLTDYIRRENPHFVEAALFENVPEMVDLLDEIWVVTAPADVRLQRLMEKRKFSLEDAKRRMDLQKFKNFEDSWRNLFPGKRLHFIDNKGDAPIQLPAPFNV